MSRIKFKPRRITIAGQVPTIDQLENGEFAINTADQKIFQRVGSSVVEVSNVGVVQGTTNEIEVSTVGSTSTIGRRHRRLRMTYSLKSAHIHEC